MPNSADGIKLACATVYDAKDSRAFGGRTYYHLQAVASQVQTMHFLGPLSRVMFQETIAIGKRKIYRRMSHKEYHACRDRRIVESYSRQIAQRLEKLDVNIVLSPESECSQPIAYLDCPQPIITWTDSPWAAVVDVYPEYSSKLICKETLRDAVANERAALSRVSRAIYWCEWGAQSAIRHYGVDPAKIRVVSPGPALEPDQALTLAEARDVVRARPKDLCRLLFVGGNWIRKGGDIAMEVAKGLNRAGLATELVIVGCQPPEGPLPKFVRALGYISRTSKEGAAKLNGLFKTSHFLLVPSCAEVYGLVFAEANAFALPSLGTDVGGIPEIVRSGINGATFPLSASPDAYCAYIEDLFIHYERYEQLAYNALSEYQTRLNNSAAARSVADAIRELL